MPTVTADSVLTPAGIEAALGTHSARFAIHVVDRCASTNSEVHAITPRDGKTVTVCVAREQTAGRGRRGRSWLAWRDHSLTFSCLYDWSADAPSPAGLSLAIGLAIANALDELGMPRAQLKWPNDVLVGGRKLAGILIELNSTAVVIGVGLNLHLPDDESPCTLADATALDRLLPSPQSPALVLAALLRHIERVCDEFCRTGLESLHKAWMQRHAFNGHAVRIVEEHGQREGVCEGIDRDGALLLRHGDGRLERIVSGEVSLRGVP